MISHVAALSIGIRIDDKVTPVIDRWFVDWQFWRCLF
jgi:hypothetical protein